MYAFYSRNNLNHPIGRLWGRDCVTLWSRLHIILLPRHFITAVCMTSLSFIKTIPGSAPRGRLSTTLWNKLFWQWPTQWYKRAQGPGQSHCFRPFNSQLQTQECSMECPLHTIIRSRCVYILGSKMNRWPLHQIGWHFIISPGLALVWSWLRVIYFTSADGIITILNNILDK